ncbi:MAG: SUMF1/EgtB/PvdO family nonheme iron enzyme [Planctomycetales bacterium]|nr:SUMF1/EgtB/PvdO family nonheme iron enzyme [Planctomycetales bacterium]
MAIRMAILVAVLSPVMVDEAYPDVFGSGANTFEIEFLTIGNPGNPSDTTGNPDTAGSVDYVYRIGKFEISREIVDKANAEGGLGIDLHDMSFVDGGARSQMPATGVSWYEALRFINWLNTSQGFPAAYKFSTQPGDPDYDANVGFEEWSEGESGFDPANRYRNSGARFYLPTSDEWYKAAFYDPAANGGEGGYWDYPTRSNKAPEPVSSGNAPGTAVFLQRVEQGPADITQAGGAGLYGAIGLAGNANEWQETPFRFFDDEDALRVARGGNWREGAHSFSVNFFPGRFPETGMNDQGFRVASIPEPSTLSLMLFVLAGHPLRRHLS